MDRRGGGALALLAFLVACGGQSDGALPAQSTGAAPLVSASASPLAAAPSASASSAPAAPHVAVRPEDEPAPSDDSPARAWDMHCDTPWQVKGCDSCARITPGHDVALTEGQITPDKLRRGHAGATFLAIYLSDSLHQGHPTIADADAIMDTVDSIIEHHPEIYARASLGDVPADRVAAYISIEGAGVFADDPAAIDRFITRGVRFVGLVHMKDDKLSTSATGKDQQHGLTKVGKDFARRIYQDGALVDVSHMSDRGFEDVREIARSFGAPIIATHSNARSVAGVPRNLSNQELRDIAESDGIAGVNFYSDYLKKGGSAAPGGATIDDAVKQAQHMIKIAGIDHVGIGSDFDGSSTPPDLADASYYPAFAAALEKAGVSKHDVHKLFSENVKRVLRWKPPANAK